MIESEVGCVGGGERENEGDRDAGGGGRKVYFFHRWLFLLFCVLPLSCLPRLRKKIGFIIVNLVLVGNSRQVLDIQRNTALYRIAFFFLKLIRFNHCYSKA